MLMQNLMRGSKRCRVGRTGTTDGRCMRHFTRVHSTHHDAVYSSGYCFPMHIFPYPLSLILSQNHNSR